MAEITLVNGLVGGLIATVVMTAFVMVLGDDSPPPTALFWSKYVGDGEPGDYVPQGMLLHLLYGVVAGGVFALLVTELALGGSTLALAGGVLWGAVFGVALLVVGAGFWMMAVLGTSPEPQQAVMFLVFHLVYGVVLGGWAAQGLL